MATHKDDEADRLRGYKVRMYIGAGYRTGVPKDRDRDDTLLGNWIGRQVAAEQPDPVEEPIPSSALLEALDAARIFSDDAAKKLSDNTDQRLAELEDRMSGKFRETSAYTHQRIDDLNERVNSLTQEVMEDHKETDAKFRADSKAIDDIHATNGAQDEAINKLSARIELTEHAHFEPEGILLSGDTLSRVVRIVKERRVDVHYANRDRGLGHKGLARDCEDDPCLSLRGLVKKLSPKLAPTP